MSKGICLCIKDKSGLSPQVKNLPVDAKSDLSLPASTSKLLCSGGKACAVAMFVFIVSMPLWLKFLESFLLSFFSFQKVPCVKGMWKYFLATRRRPSSPSILRNANRANSGCLQLSTNHDLDPSFDLCQPLSHVLLLPTHKLFLYPISKAKLPLFECRSRTVLYTAHTVNPLSTDIALLPPLSHYLHCLGNS